MRQYKLSFALLSIILCLYSNLSFGQNKKYNSLLWEISGNGMTQPSYLYGTMHISKKLAFNLGDSFYNAIKQVDVVALELNPEYWQREDHRMNKDVYKLRSFYSGYQNDYIYANTFKDRNPIDYLLYAIREEPQDVNSFLYRSEYGEENYQEDTYLDLFIFQTGKKLGKEVLGLENYLESQIMVMEGYKDEMEQQKENYLKSISRQTEDVSKKMVDAYRKGDLDALDSLYKITIVSKGFFDKVIVIRNQVHADGMDSLMKAGKRIFTGVGAAHLSGEKGVIEMLRAKGYTLRPIAQSERNTEEPKALQNILVPVTFVHQNNNDSLYSFKAPGMLLPINYAETPDHIHFPDMANGAYYQVSRIRTNGITSYTSAKRKIQILDSLAYENIPGEILSKKAIKNGNYPGMEYYNRLKSGKHIKYQIYATPLEWIIFKVSGNGDYAGSYIADTFFNSIQIHTQHQPVHYSPENGGFSMKFPNQPTAYFNEHSNDNLPEWRYVAMDPETENYYYVIHKNIYTFDFIDTDSAAMVMMAYSVNMNEEIQKLVKSKQITIQNRKVQESQYLLKNGRYLTIRCYIYGPQYFLTAVKSKNSNVEKDAYFQSFELKQYTYPNISLLKDTFLNIQVMTPLSFSSDSSVSQYYALSKSMENIYGYLTASNDTNAGVTSESANFISYETGEVITLNKGKYGKYFKTTDSAQWLTTLFKTDSALTKIGYEFKKEDDGMQRHIFLFNEKNSNRIIKKSWIFSGNEAMYINSSYDKLMGESAFVSSFFSSINFLKKPNNTSSIHSPKLDMILADLQSTDSNISKSAKNALSLYYYDTNDFVSLKRVMERSKTDTNIDQSIRYSLISKMGSLKSKDEKVLNEAADYLHSLYKSAGDTVMLQSKILIALAELNTVKGTEYFKELLLEDPLIFNQASYTIYLFTPFDTDSFKHLNILFPDILSLANTEDYRMPIYSLLAGKLLKKQIDPQLYHQYVTNLLYETNVAYKRAKQVTNSDYSNSYDYSDYISTYPEYILEYLELGAMRNSSSNTFLNIGTVLLAPYYNSQESVKKLFQKLLTSDNVNIQLAASNALFQQNIAIDDSLIQKFTTDSSTQLMAYQYFRATENKNLASKFKWKKNNYAEVMLHQMLKDKYNYKLLYANTSKKDENYVYHLTDTAKKENIIAVINLNKDSLGYYTINKEMSNVFKVKKEELDEPKKMLQDIQTRIYILNQRSGKNYFAKTELN